VSVFRKKKSGEYTRVTITLDNDTKDEISKIVEETGQSFSLIASTMLDREVELKRFMERGGSVNLTLAGRTKQLLPLVDKGLFPEEE
jgi:predicted SpoU family rRNA methylase